jgi:hypothetical protein
VERSNSLSDDRSLTKRLYARSHHGLSGGRRRVCGKNFAAYIENMEDPDLVFLEKFKGRFYQDLSFSEWLAHTYPRW